MIDIRGHLQFRHSPGASRVRWGEQVGSSFG